jgi:hypothetical protein
VGTAARPATSGVVMAPRSVMFTADELEGLAVALRVACAAVPPNHDFRRWLPALLARVTTEQVRSRKRPDLACDQPELKQWVDTAEAATLLGSTQRQAQRLAKNGALEAEKRSGIWFIELHSIQQYAGATRKEAA